MLNIIYHKSFKETGKKECVIDEIYHQMLDYIEWFDSPALIDRRTFTGEKVKDKIVPVEQTKVVKEDNCVKKRGRPKVKKE